MQRPPVIVGIGTRAHEAALLTAGAEKVFIHPSQTSLVFQLKGVSLRAGDTLLMAQPGLLKVSEYRELSAACGGQLRFQVIGHDPFPVNTAGGFSEFRKLKPKGLPETEPVQLTGRPRTIDYTLEQADALIRLWHEKPKRTPAEIAGLAKTMLGLPDEYELKTSWVRDLVIKYVGTGQRDKPAGWNGIPREHK